MAEEDTRTVSLSEESSSRRKVMKAPNAYFTDDIWLEIFPYFPLKCLFKFKCISKVWNFHLSSPNFIHKWILFNNNNNTLPWMLLYIFKQNSWIKFSFAYPDSHSQFISTCKGFSFEFLNPNSSTYHAIYFLGSSNGLVLCLKNKIHCVCNPLTQQWVQLPPSPPISYERQPAIHGFVCDLFSLPTTSYMVVRILPWQGDSNKFTIQVFSSDLGQWNSYQVFFPGGITLRFPRRASPGIPTDCVIIHKNVLYWMGWYDRIVVYNLENNESDFRQCRFIDLPDKGIYPVRCLGELNGLIFYARIIRYKETLCVWVLQEENFHLLHYNIDIHDLFTEVDIMLNLDGTRWGHDLIEVLGFSPTDSNVIMLGYKNYIWAYHIGTKKYEELCHPSFLGNKHSASDEIVYLPLVLKPMPTILPPRSW